MKGSCKIGLIINNRVDFKGRKRKEGRESNIGMTNAESRVLVAV